MHETDSLSISLDMLSLWVGVIVVLVLTRQAVALIENRRLYMAIEQEIAEGKRIQEALTGSEQSLRGTNEELTMSNRDFTILFNTGRLLAGTLEVKEICRILHRQVFQPLLSAPNMLIALYDSPAQVLHCGFAILDGKEMEASAFLPLPLGKRPLSDTLRTRQARILDLTQTDYDHPQSDARDYR